MSKLLSGRHNAASPLRPRRPLRNLAVLLILLAPLQADRAPAQERSTFGATVSRVLVDVIVTDDGEFVDDLMLEDFLVFEDGQRQQVLSVELVDLGKREVLALDPALGAESPPPPANDVDRRGARERESAGEPDPGIEPSGDAGRLEATDLGAIIYVIDGPSINPSMKGRFSNAWIDLLDEAPAVNVPHAAFMITSFGRVEELVPLTLEIGRIRQAAEALEVMPLTQKSLADRLIEFNNLIVGLNMVNSSIPDGGADAGEGQLQAFTKEDEELSRSLYSLGLLESFCDALAARPGRTALVWVSGGVKVFEAGPFSVVGGQASPIWLAKRDPRAQEALEKLQRAANSSNVSIYALDPTPLDQIHRVGASAAIQGRSAGRLNSDAMWQALDGFRDGLRQTAAETGGEAIIGATDLRQAIRTIEQDTGRFYLVTYAPPLPSGDGEYHEIRVEVQRRGVDVRARNGYVEHARDVSLNRLVTAALALPGTIDGLPVSVEAYRLWGQGTRTTLVLGASIDSEAVQTGVRPDGSLGASLRIHARVLDGERNQVAEADDDLSAQVRDFQESSGDTHGPPGAGMVLYRKGWVLEPGVYDIRVALLDQLGGEVGASRLEVVLPEASEGWRTSDLMLITTESMLNPLPIAQGRFRASQFVQAYLEVRDGAEPVLNGRILTRSATPGAGVPASTPETAPETTPETARTVRVLTPKRLRGWGAGMHRGSLQLPADLPPGLYTLEVVATDDEVDEERTFEVPLEVLPPLAPARAEEKPR